ncbi:sensor histidine kinase [Arthrobacter crystallopoietes]|uniref:sensor histidine kinase n=1 Tax=Crystallibacter crystallopoietes TaxID=37928 RepID=UPI001ABDEAAA|nr:HAMP domain-containing sensor histidine kinase [Arthrobacter crystallopoietes]QTG79529.1 HAMP domain-containing histidine kinase [Arthrobacter crystallopoietes]
MHRPRTQLPFAESFHSIGLRARVVLCQLPLVSCMLVVAAVFALVEPAMFANPWFRLCLLLHAVVLALCALIPWERLPVRSFHIIPIIDFALIALLLHADGEALSGLGMLLVFPVIWLSVSVLKSRILISFAGSLLAVLVPVLLSEAVNTPHLLRLVLAPVIMLAISVSVHIVANNLEFQRAQIAAAEAELHKVLQASREREQLLHAVVDSIDVGLVAVDSRGAVTLVNRQQEEFAVRASPPGCAAAPDLQTEQSKIYDDDGVTPLPPEARAVYKASRSEEFSGQIMWLGDGAQRIALSATARKISGHQARIPGPRADAESAGSVVLFKDVTDQLAALAAKDDFMSAISHELRTPLTSILAYVDLALEHPGLPGQVTKHLAVADRNAERLLELVSDFLSSSAGTLEIQTEAADLADVVKRSMLSATAGAAAKGIALVNEVDRELPAHIDPGRMTQVMDNLLSNAVKYSPRDSIVRIRGWQDQGTSVLEVEDTGYGMDAADQRRVFDRYFRSSSARSSGAHGTGLGLVVTKEVVNRHGGTIEVASRLGAGTKVTVKLPTDVQRATRDAGRSTVVGDL